MFVNSRLDDVVATWSLVDILAPGTTSSTDQHGGSYLLTGNTGSRGAIHVLHSEAIVGRSETTGPIRYDFLAPDDSNRVR